MKTELQIEATILEEFQKQAWRRGENPGSLLTRLMREHLEDWEDEEEEEKHRAELTRDYTDEEVVEIVRQYRREKKAQLAAANQAKES